MKDDNQVQTKKMRERGVNGISNNQKDINHDYYYLVQKSSDR